MSRGFEWALINVVWTSQNYYGWLPRKLGHRGVYAPWNNPNKSWASPKKLAIGLTHAHAHVLASLPPTHATRANGGWPFKRWFCKFVRCCNSCNVWNLYKAQSFWSSYNSKLVQSLELCRSCIKRTFQSKPDRNYRAPISVVKSTTEALKTMGVFWHILICYNSYTHLRIKLNG